MLDLGEQEQPRCGASKAEKLGAAEYLSQPLDTRQLLGLSSTASSCSAIRKVKVMRNRKKDGP